MAEFKKTSGSKVEFSLEIPESDIKVAHKAALDSFRKNVSVKGFRKGHAPDEVVIQSIGLERISYEAMNRAIDESYRKFIEENKISPVNHPAVDVKDWEKKPILVKCAVEVFPEVKIGDISKIKVSPVKVEVTDNEVDEVIATVMSDSQLSKPVDREVKKGDVVIIDFRGYGKDGEILPNTEGKEQRVRLGVGHFLADLEAGIMGMKAGEEKKKIKVKFPKDYHAKDMAGKSVPFEVKLHKVEEINIADFSNEMVKTVTGEEKSVEKFRSDLKDMITGNKAQSEKKKKAEEYQDKLVKMTKCDLPESWIQGEIESRLERIKTSPQFQHDPEAFWKQVGKTEDQLRKEFKSSAVESLTSYLALTEAVKQANIELDDAEIAQAKHEADQAPEGVQKGQALEKAILSRKIDKFLDGVVS